MNLRCAPLLLVVLLGASPAAGQTFTEFRISIEGFPLGIAPGPDGNLWFTVPFYQPDRADHRRRGHHLVPDPHPAFVAIRHHGGAGYLWFTEAGGNSVWRMTPSGIFTEFPLPTPGSSQGTITTGPDGNLWFGEWKGGNSIGRITPVGVITEFPSPTPSSRTWGIAAGPDGALWFTEEIGNKIGRITTSGAITEFPIPTPGSRPYGIVAGMDGNLYFIESARSKIGRITTSGVITEFLIPTTGGYSITSGSDGAIWFTEFGAGKIGRMSLGPVDRFSPVQPDPREGKPRVLPPRAGAMGPAPGNSCLSD